MQDFNLYLALGIEHIITWEALDHILFVAALCLRYGWKDWKKVAIMVTAFTVGHSVTLALTALGYLVASMAWIEFLIPVTIAVTAVNNLWQQQKNNGSHLPMIYFFALFFGMIHGMAYASTLLNLEGAAGLVSHLFAFNLGIEVAQLAVVGIVLLLSFIFVNVLSVPWLWWLRISSLAILVFSLNMAFQRIPF